MTPRGSNGRALLGSEGQNPHWLKPNTTVLALDTSPTLRKNLMSMSCQKLRYFVAGCLLISQHIVSLQNTTLGLHFASLICILNLETGKFPTYHYLQVSPKKTD